MTHAALLFLGCLWLVGGKPAPPTQAPPSDPWNEVYAGYHPGGNALRVVKDEGDIKKAIEAIDKETELLRQRPVLPNEIPSDVKPTDRASAMVLLEERFKQIENASSY